MEHKESDFPSSVGDGVVGSNITAWLPQAAVPLTFWLWIFGAVFLAGAAGFLGGALMFWRSSKTRLRKAVKNRLDLIPTVKAQLKAAVDASTALKDCRELVLSPEDTANLSQQRDTLLETLNEIVELQKQVAATMAGQSVPQAASGPQPFKVKWQIEPKDELTDLPNGETMMDNLAKMVAVGTDHRRPSGVLFVQLNGFDPMKERHGEEAAETLLKKFVRVIIRAVREQDLVCRYDHDTLAVLFPSLEDKQGHQLAHAVRKTIRSHNFRVSEAGPMVLLNAHYGYTDCLPHENEDLVLNRAGDALEKSRRCGFNQMHIHTGETLLAFEPSAS